MPSPAEPRPLLPENVYGHTKKVSRFRAALAAERTRLGRPLSIVDIGCGSGFAVSQFLASPDDSYLGIDMHAPSIAWATQRYGTERHRYQVCLAEQLQSAGERFDAVVLSDILEHVDDPGLILRSAHALLNPGGLLLASIPNGHGPFEIESAVARTRVGRAVLRTVDLLCAALDKSILRGRWTRAAAREPKEIPYNGDSGHVQFFRTADMRELLRASGFTVEGHGNLTLFSGPYSNYLFGPFASLVRLNEVCARRAPHAIASAWVFVARRADAAHD